MSKYDFAYGLGMKAYEENKGMIGALTVKDDDRIGFVFGYLNAWCWDFYHANEKKAILPSQFMVGYQIGFFKSEEIDSAFVEDQEPDIADPVYELGRKMGVLDRYRNDSVALKKNSTRIPKLTLIALKEVQEALSNE